MARSQRQTLLSESLNSFLIQKDNEQKEEKIVTEKVNEEKPTDSKEKDNKKTEVVTEQVKNEQVVKETISNDIKEEISDAKEVEEKAIRDTDEAGSIKIPSGLMPGSREVEPSINKVDERVEKNKERIKGDFLAHEVEDVAKLARGRKGAKLERKFISLTKSNQEYLDKQSRYYGMNATTFINYIIEEYKMKNPPLYQNLITIEHSLNEED